MDLVKNTTGWTEVLTAQSKPLPTLEQLNAALRSVYDLWDLWGRWPFLLLGDTAKGAKEGKLYAPKIEIGIKKNELVKPVLDGIKVYIENEMDRGRCDYKEITDNWIKYTWKANKSDLVSVPMELKIIHRHYQFFKFPDKIVYNYDEFNIPNPFDKYYKARFIIQ